MPRKSPPVIASKNVKTQAIVLSKQVHSKQSAENSRKHPMKMKHARACKSEIDKLSSKSKPLRVPPGKIVQAQTLLVQGKSQREIGRALHMSPMTVAKIIKTEDFQGFIKRMQEKLFALAPIALASFQAQLKVDGHLAYVLLKDLGIIPPRESLASMMAPAPTEAETGVERQLKMVAAVLLEGHENFGVDLPENVKAAMANFRQQTAVGTDQSGLANNPQLH
jgi:hypothetical protein